MQTNSKNIKKSGLSTTNCKKIDENCQRPGERTSMQNLRLHADGENVDNKGMQKLFFTMIILLVITGLKMLSDEQAYSGNLENYISAHREPDPDPPKGDPAPSHYKDPG